MVLNYAQTHTYTHLFLLIPHDNTNMLARTHTHTFTLLNTHTHTGGSYYALRLECFDGIIAVTSEEKETEGGMERGMGMEGEKKEESADTLSMLMLRGSTPHL